MEITTVGINSPGEMGQVMGALLKKNGLRVIAALEGRSARTRRLAGEAGIEDVGTLARLVTEAGMVLSVLVPGAAVAAARETAAAMGAADSRPLYVDCNAISPATTRQAGQAITEAGARFVDASIIGPPPRKPGDARFYASGEHAGDFALLADYGLDVRVLGPEIGQASGIKMCYAGLTKGLAALSTEVLVAAERLGLSEALTAEFKSSQPFLFEHMAHWVPAAPPKAHRWIAEMEEIAATYEQVGLTPRMELGAADMCRFMAQTPLGKEAPEERDKSRSLAAVVTILAGT